MHYHGALMELFRSTLGVGDRGQLNFYKYSPQRECFIGFDQAYVVSELSEDEMFQLLSSKARNDGYALGDRFFGYFLQFK
jgi:hypothetical protein